MIVYKFIGREFGVSAIALRRLKVSRINELNDPFEFLAADLLDRRKRELFSNWKEKMAEQFGMVCFSREWGNPLLWGHYAENHSGLALGFEIPDDKLTEVLYQKNRISVEIHDDSGGIVDGESVLRNLMKIKLQDWEYESESRSFHDLAACQSEGKLRFVPFSESMKLRKVILGMRCDLPTDIIKKLVNEKENGVFVLKAGMAKRKFKIIESREARA